MTRPDIEAMRRARVAADRTRRSLLGELVKTLRDRPRECPRRVSAILEKIAAVELAGLAAAKDIGDALELERKAGHHAPHHDFGAVARISALVAAHIEGLELIEDPDWNGAGNPYRWRVVGPTGAHRPVSNYATDLGTARRALEHLDTDQRREVASRLVRPGSGTAGLVDVLMAAPVDICLAMLAARGISPKSSPMTIAN